MVAQPFLLGFERVIPRRIRPDPYIREATGGFAIFGLTSSSLPPPVEGRWKQRSLSKPLRVDAERFQAGSGIRREECWSVRLSHSCWKKTRG